VLGSVVGVALSLTIAVVPPIIEGLQQNKILDESLKRFGLYGGIISIAIGVIPSLLQWLTC
jgi:uncharacterized membrane protein (DUF441 family)